MISYHTTILELYNNSYVLLKLSLRKYILRISFNTIISNKKKLKNYSLDLKCIVSFENFLQSVYQFI